MNNSYISDHLNHGIKGHVHYEFVDVAVNDDRRLFIDPVLIETAETPWCREANSIIRLFFDKFYQAYEQNDEVKKIEILAHAREQNGTKLGYGNGHNGKGNTAQGLIHIFRPLEKLVLKINTIRKPEDLPVLIPEFAEDGLSDLLTNILHDQLNQFTTQQLNKFGIKNNSTIRFWTWDRSKEDWEGVERPCYRIDGRELLLVPKNIVRKKYLFSTHQYFTRIILERKREAGYGVIDGKLIPKKDIVAGKRNSGDSHWEYNEAISYTTKCNDALEEYHKKLPSFYAYRNFFMKDNELDDFLYGNQC